MLDGFSPAVLIRLHYTLRKRARKTVILVEHFFRAAYAAAFVARFAAGCAGPTSLLTCRRESRGAFLSSPEAGVQASFRIALDRQ
jgi:hypothetical protein